jgi:hypothetical protein
MTTFQAKIFTPRSGQVVALLAHTTCLKIGSIKFDCCIVSGTDARGMNALVQVCNGLPLIRTVPVQHGLQHENGGFSTRSSDLLILSKN